MRRAAFQALLPPHQRTSSGAQAPSQQLGGGRSHPRSSQVFLAQKPHSGGLPPEPDPLPLRSSRNLKPFGQQPLCLHLGTITDPPLPRLLEEEARKEENVQARGAGPIQCPVGARPTGSCAVPWDPEKAGGGGSQPLSFNLGTPFQAGAWRSSMESSSGAHCSYPHYSETQTATTASRRANLSEKHGHGGLEWGAG